jgi:gluconate 2-dehydrogenase gamma chain
MNQPTDRRAFLGALAALGASARVAQPAPAPAALSAVHSANHAQSKAPRSPDIGFRFLNEPEIEFLDAALEQLIPSDALGPGAREAGVTRYIDGQLAGAWGAGADQYRQGPWGASSAEFGYQAQLSPQQIYRLGLAAVDEWCVKHHAARFAALPASLRVEVLKSLQHGTLDCHAPPEPQVFFGLLWRNTLEGFFSDPIYGGNAGKAGWKLIGFPGVAAAYGEELKRHNVPYRVAPISIADLQGHLVEVDAHGHPRRGA